MPVNNFTSNESWSVILNKIVSFKCDMLATSTSYQVNNFSSKAPIEHFKKLNFNKMSSMIHNARAMHKIIEGDHFDQRGNTSILLCHFYLMILGRY